MAYNNVTCRLQWSIYTSVTLFAAQMIVISNCKLCMYQFFAEFNSKLILSASNYFIRRQAVQVRSFPFSLFSIIMSIYFGVSLQSRTFNQHSYWRMTFDLIPFVLCANDLSALARHSFGKVKQCSDDVLCQFERAPHDSYEPSKGKIFFPCILTEMPNYNHAQPPLALLLL
jgi:hypothetical protein